MQSGTSLGQVAQECGKISGDKTALRSVLYRSTLDYNPVAVERL